MRESYALINLNNLKNNICEIKKYYNQYKYYFGVVKANAYGHGIKTIKTMEEAGLNYLTVSSLEEALAVREYTNLPILCFGYVNVRDINIVIENNITLSIISYDYFKELLKTNKKIKVHLKINSGMNRFGINDKNEVNKIMEQIKKSNMELEGIYTHLATSGVSDHYYDYQINQFKELTSNINLDEIKIVHIFNSLALARHEKLPFANGVRLGLMMYGFSYNVGKMNFIGKLKRIWKLRFSSVSQTSLTNNLKLKKVLSLHSEVVNIVSVKKGELVGYNFGYVAHNNILVAIVPLGHADGITRNYKRVIINNNYYDIINICMDYIMVKIDNKIKVHDKVDLINDKITIGSIAKNDTPHHILVSISDRVERRYEE